MTEFLGEPIIKLIVDDTKIQINRRGRSIMHFSLLSHDSWIPFNHSRITDRIPPIKARRAAIPKVL